MNWDRTRQDKVTDSYIEPSQTLFGSGINVVGNCIKMIHSLFISKCYQKSRLTIITLCIETDRPEETV